MRVKLVQQAHWANEIAVEEHAHVMIKLASDSDSSSDTDTEFYGDLVYKYYGDLVYKFKKNEGRADFFWSVQKNYRPLQTYWI